MPKIHKLELLPEIEIIELKLNWPESLMNLRKKKIEKYLFEEREYCICVHPESTHRRIDSNICSYNGEYCICNGFNPVTFPFKLNIEVTNADLFEFEVKDHSERDSLSWWNEFESWKKINANN